MPKMLRNALVGKNCLCAFASQAENSIALKGWLNAAPHFQWSRMYCIASRGENSTANAASHISPGRQPWEIRRPDVYALKERVNDAPFQGAGLVSVCPGLTPWANMTLPFQG